MLHSELKIVCLGFARVGREQPHTAVVSVILSEEIPLGLDRLTRSACTAFLRPISLDNPDCFQTTVEVFEQGLQIAGKDAQCVGYRPKVSDEKFADHFVWKTYGEVDARRKNLGSAIQGLFDSGDAVAADGLETVALWSMNIPGEYKFPIFAEMRGSS